jgi:hypothetical protein
VISSWGAGTVLVEETPSQDCPCGRVFFQRLFLWRKLLPKTVLVARLTRTVLQMSVFRKTVLVEETSSEVLPKTVLVEEASLSDCPCGRDFF